MEEASLHGGWELDPNLFGVLTVIEIVVRSLKGKTNPVKKK